MRGRILLLIAAIYALALPKALSDIAIVDQENDVGGELITSVFSIGQSFMPTLSSVSMAEFFLLTGGAPSTVTLNVFEGSGYGGTLLGSSDPVTFNNTSLEVIHFDFAVPVGLTPGNTYTFRLLASDFGYGALYSSSNPYSRGDLYDDSGGVAAGFDLVFAEGIPEPSSAWLLLVGAAAILWSQRKRLGLASN